MKTRWVLLRGLARESGHWGEFRAQFERAIPGAEVFLADLPGTGARVAEPAPRSIPGILAAVRRQLPPEFADSAAAPKFLLGHSLGGMVALEWAARYPESIAGLVLLNSSVGGLSPVYRRLRPGSLYYLARIATSLRVEKREERVLKWISTGSGRMDTLRAWTDLARARPIPTLTAVNQIIAAASYRVPAAVKPPALVLSSGADRVVHPSCSESLARHLRAAHHVRAEANHDLALDAPDWVLENIQTWLKSRMQ